MAGARVPEASALLSNRKETALLVWEIVVVPSGILTPKNAPGEIEFPGSVGVGFGGSIGASPDAVPATA